MACALRNIGKGDIKLKEHQYKAIKKIIVDNRDTVCVLPIDNFPYRQIFYLDKSRPKKLHSRKEPFKSSKIPKFG